MGWVGDIKDVGRVPYRLPELIAAVAAGQTVYVAEGEKDVETLRTRGLAATCNPMGAGKWGKVAEVAAEVLSGADVVVIPDDDEAGRRHAKDVVDHLLTVAASVKVLPHFPGAIDVTSWMENGGTREELEEMVRAAEKTELPPHPWAQQRITFADILEREPEPPKWLVTGVLEAGSLVFVYGKPSSLKSMLVADLALCVASGKPWLAGENQPALPTVQIPVVWIDLDNGEKRTRERVRALATAHGIDHPIPLTVYSFPNPFDLAKDDSVTLLRDTILADGAGLAVVDTFINATNIQSENDNAQLRGPMFALRTLCEQTGATIIAIHHPAKNTKPGESHEDLRGGGAIAGALDLALRVERKKQTEGDVTVTATKTRGAEVRPFAALWTYDKNEAGTLLSSRFRGIRYESRQRAANAELEATILHELRPEKFGPATQEELKEAVGACQKQRFSDALRRLEEDGQVVVTLETFTTDKGRQSRRKRYALAEKKPYKF